MKKFLGIIALTATLFGAGQASAVPITGGIEIGGQVSTATLLDLSQVNFIGTGTVLASVGDLAAAVGPVTLVDIVFAAPGTIWSVGGFSFAADSFSGLMLNGQGGKDFSANGTLSGAGFDDTQGRFEFSSNAGQVLASFSSSSFPVPEPATLALFGAGLIGAGIAGRRRKSKS